MKFIVTHIGAAVIGALTCLVIMLMIRQRELEAPGVSFSLSENGLYQVEHVIDGDTFVLENGLHIRLLGIDAPETGRYISEPTPFSDQARARLKSLVEGRKVRLQFGDRRVGPHGRIIANIYVPSDEIKPGDPTAQDARGIWVSEILVREGLAEAKTFWNGDGGGFIGTKKLQAAEHDAKKRAAGIWSLTKDSPMVNRTPDGRPFKWVAAANSDVFHPAASKLAGRISPMHRIGWPDVFDALISGRRPSKYMRKKIDAALERIDRELAGPRVEPMQSDRQETPPPAR